MAPTSAAITLRFLVAVALRHAIETFSMNGASDDHFLYIRASQSLTQCAAT